MDEIQKIQKFSLDIMKDIDKICRKNNIKYSLCGGSVIGAKLYEGFIPWDDDIDIMMDRNNYDRFLKIYTEQKKDYYNIVNYRTCEIKEVPALFSRVVDSRTKTIETLNSQTVKEGNVFVDITVFDNIKSEFDYKVKDMKRSLVYMYYYKAHNMLPGTKWKRNILGIINSFINLEKYYNKVVKYEKYISKYKNQNTKYCSELMSTIFPGRLYTKKIFDEYIDIKFEDTNFMIVKEYNEYLFQRYGRREFTKDNKSGMHSHIKLVGCDK